MSYVTFRGQKREIISQPMWDTVSVAAATATATASFFQSPRGTGAKTLEDTNLVLAGQLPRPQVFYCKAVSFAIKATVPAAVTVPINIDDFQEILDGTAAIIIGSKVMLEVPLYWCVSGFGVNVQAGSPTSAASLIINNLTNGLPGMPYRWFLKHRLMVDENENFRVDCVWKTAFNTAIAADLVFVLDGELIRSIQ